MRRVCLGFLTGGAAESWPDCQEQGVVLRHAGLTGIFVDLTEVGAKEGCWLSDCTKTDKYVCPSAGECASACARVEACRFWTYEPGILKCFMRSKDAGREQHGDFVSGSRACRPGERHAPSGRFPVPFAQAALWAAELPALRSCDAGLANCENPYGSMAVWRYAVNNLRLAMAGLSAAEQAQNREAVQYIQQIAADLLAFFQQPTAETFQVAVQNARLVFDALRGWLQAAPATEVVLSGGDAVPHLPQGRSVALPPALPAARIQLADGHVMPLVGFGTWMLLGQACYDATLAALRSGYRHLDTAQAYQNEREVGLALQHSGIPRSEVFLVTKLSDPEDYEQAERRCLEQLQALGTEYFDLYLLHTPGDSRASREAAWRAMERLHAQGRVRSLGVSNFGIPELQELLDFARVRPVYLQNKLSIYSPGEQQLGTASVLAFAREQGLAFMGYSVLNPWPLLLPPMEDPHVRAIAGRYGRSPAQVLHRWALQQGAAVIPKSATPVRIEENARVLDFELSELDMRLLSGLAVLADTLPAKPGHTPAWIEDVYGLGRL